MRAIILWLINFVIFYFFIPPSVLANKADLIDSLKNKGIEIRINKKTFTAKEEKRKFAPANIQKQAAQSSYSELKKENIIPSVIIAVNSLNIKEAEINKLINKLNELKNKGKKINYYTDDNLVGLYVYLYGDEAEYHKLQSELVSENIKISSNRKITRQYTPNDTYYPQQWNMSNIRWSNAMDIGPGTTQVKIGIIDNGVNVEDLDLNSNIWQNSGEIYNDGNDNDSNGYIDDKYGCNFYMKLNDGYSYTPCLKEYIKEDTLFDTKHGTYVAQIAAAVTDNSYGIAGVCPTCEVAVLKITDDFGNGDFSLLPYVFSYAISKGFKVLNLSYGSLCPFDASEDIYAADINSLINTYGIHLIQAGGNNGAMTQAQCINTCGSSNSYCYSTARNQAYYYVDGKSVNNKINVASINSSNQRSSFSNYDASSSVISIAAPGENLPIYDAGLYSVSGTSFSAPVVSGAIGFLLSKIYSYETPTVNKIKTWLYNYGSKISTDYNISTKKLDLLPLISLSEAEEKVKDTDYLYVARFWSPSLSNHFWSSDATEIQNVRDYEYNVRQYEGISYYAFRSDVVLDAVPLYRFYDPVRAVHFYTASEDEKNNVIANESEWWNYEGIAYYVYPQTYNGSSKSVYRFYSHSLRHHFWTASITERDNILANESNVWDLYDGLAFKIPNFQ